MSDCGVCVYFDGESAEEFWEEFRVAAKSHKCSECGREIPKGAKYQYVKMICGGEFCQYKTCLVCFEIRKAFCCEGVMYGGTFWESMEEGDVYSGLNSSCFDRLQTPEAKSYLREQWMNWKGLTA